MLIKQINQQQAGQLNERTRPNSAHTVVVVRWVRLLEVGRLSFLRIEYYGPPHLFPGFIVVDGILHVLITISRLQSITGSNLTATMP